ncbi:MAG: esterase [Burkholderiales bacterium]|nr:esterase [Burkholderiales bacterium]
MRLVRPALTALVVALLAACGSDSPNPTTGALIEPASTVGTLPKAALGGACDVTVVALNYSTSGAKAGEFSNASGGMLVPSGTDAACKGPFPIIAYSRGTEVSKPRTMASLTDPEMGGMAKAFATAGYIVVATDYLGFAKSSYPFHPYLHADSEATAVIDSIRAARAYAALGSIPLSGKVMLYGYSQGGHSSLATQRAIESSAAIKAEISIAAAGHGAAPGALGIALRSGAEIAGGQFFVPFLITAWQKVYGDVYTTTADIFKAPYASYIQDLLPSATETYTTLVTSGKLPATTYNDLMFQPTFVPSLQNGTSAVIRAAQRNDLVNSGWNPSSQTRFCAGSGDPTVLYATAQKLAIDKWGTLPNVTSRDVDPEVQASAAAQGLTPLQVLGAYHGGLAPPVCLLDMRAYFDARR